MAAEAGQGGRLEAAVQKLDRAMTMLEQRTKLAADLDAARARERELEEAAVQASEALAKAVAELRAQLQPEAG